MKGRQLCTFYLKLIEKLSKYAYIKALLCPQLLQANPQTHEEEFWGEYVRTRPY